MHYRWQYFTVVWHPPGGRLTEPSSYCINKFSKIKAFSIKISRKAQPQIGLVRRIDRNTAGQKTAGKLLLHYVAVCKVYAVGQHV